ncbi:MAG: MerR family transcriptional regulator [Burkholderiaceae bacterium]|nr:MerR family transcriptional regulator [Burkholderiaceae bacterium]
MGRRPEPASRIAAVERDTGLSKDTLRVWERRYGFPRPARDTAGERLYPAEQLDRLRLIRRLLDVGHRPGRIVRLSAERLRELVERELAVARAAAPPRGAPSDDPHASLQRLAGLIRSQRIDDLRQALGRSAQRMGPARFVAEIAVPLNRLIGDAWAHGELEVYQEHLCTEAMQDVLRRLVAGIVAPALRPCVLLTTFPPERHGIGLLMAQAMLALEGCRCVSLGVQTPVRDIVLAAEAQRADIVALSFSASLNARQVLAFLVELRERLPSAVEIWAGGGCAALARTLPAGVRVVAALSEIAPAVTRWRDQAGSAMRGSTNSVSTPV